MSTTPAPAICPASIGSCLSYPMDIITYVRDGIVQRVPYAVQLLNYAAFGAAATAVGTSLLAGKNVITLIDLTLIPAGTAAASGALIATAAVALAFFAVQIFAYKLLPHENTRELYQRWAWLALIPIAAVAYATSTAYVTMATFVALNCLGIYVAKYVYRTFGDHETTLSPETLRARADAARAEEEAAQAAEDARIATLNRANAHMQAAQAAAQPQPQAREVARPVLLAARSDDDVDLF